MKQKKLNARLSGVANEKKIVSCNFGYPPKCKECGGDMELKVKPFFQKGSNKRLMLVGQDPTIRKKSERVKQVLMLDEERGRLKCWLRQLLGENNFGELTIYATNVVKCTFEKLPSSAPKGGFKFLKPYFETCKTHLMKELLQFNPSLVLTLGEPTHKFFISILDNKKQIADSMKDAFTGEFAKAKFQGLVFDYTPCLHITTFRVAESYGRAVSKLKDSIAHYLVENE